MYAIVRANHRGDSLAMSDVAGRPLIVRQLEWLHACGIEHVAVEVASGPAGERVMAHLQERDAIGRRAICVPTAGATRPHVVAKRAGFTRAAAIVVLDHNVIGDADLVRMAARVSPGGGMLRLPAPEVLSGVPSGVIRILRPGAGSAIGREANWAVALRNESDVRSLSFAVLEGSLPEVEGGWRLQVHATSVATGVWIARGASVHPSAELVGPLLVGTGAIVGAGARLGPCVVLGPNAVVDRRARLRDTVVAPGAIVGEGVALQSCDVQEDARIVDRSALEDREPIEVDRLLVGAAGSATASGRWGSRGLASVALAAFGVLVVVVSPALIASLVFGMRGPYERARALVAELLEACMGTRALVGVGDDPLLDASGHPGLRELASLAPRGLFVIEAGLVGPNASALARLSARAWYARHKSLRVDLRVLLRAARGSGRAPARAARAQLSSDAGGREAVSSWSSASRR